ncbi:MAG: VOC family protein [Alphaproteobacteria bacterium]
MLPDRPNFERAFATADVTAAMARAVQAGARLVTHATHMPLGQTFAYVKAPEGTLIAICTSVAA